jgi:hypothetical protein
VSISPEIYEQLFCNEISCPTQSLNQSFIIKMLAFILFQYLGEC